MSSFASARGSALRSGVNGRLTETRPRRQRPYIHLTTLYHKELDLARNPYSGGYPEGGGIAFCAKKSHFCVSETVGKRGARRRKRVSSGTARNSVDSRRARRFRCGIASCVARNARTSSEFGRRAKRKLCGFTWRVCAARTRVARRPSQTGRAPAREERRCARAPENASEGAVSPTRAEIRLRRVSLGARRLSKGPGNETERKMVFFGYPEEYGKEAKNETA